MKMNMTQLISNWRRHFRAFVEAELPISSPQRGLADAGSLVETAEQAGASSSLSVALMQMGLIGHLPEIYPPQAGSTGTGA